jgi:hypothetical protein
MQHSVMGKYQMFERILLLLYRQDDIIGTTMDRFLENKQNDRDCIEKNLFNIIKVTALLTSVMFLTI